jgi:hypothetical protein
MVNLQDKTPSIQYTYAQGTIEIVSKGAFHVFAFSRCQDLAAYFVELLSAFTRFNHCLTTAPLPIRSYPRTKKLAPLP